MQRSCARRRCPRPSRRPLLWVLFLFALLLPLLSLPGHSQESAPEAPTALLLTWEGAIGPASADYLARALETAEDEGHDLIILRLDTPGGLDVSMRQMIRAILASPVPVVTWVWPRGARAASAGTYILYASHVAAMAPSTTLGAATPVRVGASLKLQVEGDAAVSPEEEGTAAEPSEAEEEGGSPTDDTPDAMSAKMIEDAVAYIRGLAELHGRNAEWAERAVREAASLSASEAEAQQVVDLVAGDLETLLAEIDGRSVVMEHGQPQSISTLDMVAVEQAPDWRTQLLAVISNPNLALVLMMIGIYGLIFEFSNPGALYPGTLGAISLLLGLFSLSILPLDYAGLALLLLGVALMTAEAFLPSFGILGVGGAVAFALGATMLFDTFDAPGFELSWWTIGSMTALSLLLLAIVLRLAAGSFRQPVVSGSEHLVGSQGEVLGWDKKGGRVRVQGEVWQARARKPLASGQAVRITGLPGRMGDVEPVNPKPEDAIPQGREKE